MLSSLYFKLPHKKGRKTLLKWNSKVQSMIKIHSFSNKGKRKNSIGVASAEGKGRQML